MQMAALCRLIVALLSDFEPMLVTNAALAAVIPPPLSSASEDR